MRSFFFTGPFTLAQIAAVILPLLLIPVTRATFHALHRRYGYPGGYFVGFLMYWIFWCLLVPAVLLGGPAGIIALFQPAPSFTALGPLTHVLLWSPVIFPLLFMFIPRVRKTVPAILLASLALGIIIGVTEEILWRGVYIRLFPGSVFWAVLYPAVFFGLWHFSPQVVVKNRMPGGAVSFVSYAVILGLLYGFAAVFTGSIFWPTLAHALHDSLGLGGYAYAAWLAKPTQRPVEA